VFAAARLLIHEADRELLQPLVKRLARPQTMPTTGRLDARWQWVAGTQLVAQSAERDAQEVGDLGISVVHALRFRLYLHDEVRYATSNNLSTIGITRRFAGQIRKTNSATVVFPRFVEKDSDRLGYRRFMLHHRSYVAFRAVFF